MPNKLSQFWQELKRRRVIQVITVYAGAAFVIIELVNNVTEPLRLPEWTPTLVIILLLVGFPIAVILSWIYDIHPEGGMVKTQPADKVKADDIPKSTNSWKVASYISFVVILGLILLNVISGSGRNEILDKSIAVLPFINDSQDEENAHFINGIMEELLINLQSVKELKVPGRTSTEQYRDNPKPIPVISAEMNVAYIIEGSGQRYGNNIRLRVQLVEGETDKHIWAKSYEEQISKPEDIFRIQSEIAQSIANELQAVITPEEKQIIEKIPTSDLTAYDFYQRGREEYVDYKLKNDMGALERAGELYNEAVVNDSTFARAYVGLAQVYWGKYEVDTYFAEDFMDSVLVLADIALSYDDQLAEAYSLRGAYHYETGKLDQALRDFDKSIEINPNDWYSYSSVAAISLYADKVKTLENYHKALSLNRGPERLNLLKNLGFAYWEIGLFEQAGHYCIHRRN